MVEVTVKHTSDFLVEVADRAGTTVEITGWQLNDGLLHMAAVVSDGDFYVFEDELDAHDLAQSWERLADLEADKRQYWISAHPSIRDRDGVEIAETNNVFLKKSKYKSSWENWRTVLHGSDENSRRVIEGIDDIGLSPKIETVRQTPQVTAGPSTLPDGVISDKQREVVEIALENGYFDVPKNCTLEDIADEADVSAGAVSKRLTRAQRRLFSLLAED